jgi:hypothetical protein
MTEASDLFAAVSFARVRLPPQEAQPLPHWAYTSPVWYEREVERIFRKAWSYVGHVSQVPNAGDYFTVEIAGVPLIVVWGQSTGWFVSMSAPRRRRSGWRRSCWPRAGRWRALGRRACPCGCWCSP